jgi:chemotaxis protein MotB
MYGKAGVLLKSLILVAAVGIAAGCSTELRKLQGANQELVKQRDALNSQITDLKTQLATCNADKADLQAKLSAAETEANYWKGQAEAYGAANKDLEALARSQAEKTMRDLAIRIGAVYLPGGGLRLPSEILFESGKAELKASAKAKMAEAAKAFQAQGLENLFLRIDGHTDNQGIKASHWKDNMELSQARSRAVWLEMRKDGVAPEKMFTAGFGEFRPADTNATAKGRQTNRRVEFWLVTLPAQTAGEAAPAAAEAAPAVEAPAAESAAPAAKEME